jgi:hypothetical protein
MKVSLRIMVLLMGLLGAGLVQGNFNVPLPGGGPPTSPQSRVSPLNVA